MTLIRKSKPHVLIMPSWYKTPETPVLGTFFEEQARALKKEGYDVGIIYPEYTPPGEILTGPPHEKHDFYIDNGIPTFNIKTQAGIPKMRRLSYRLYGKAVNEVYLQYVKNFGKPDIIHAHSVFHAGIAGFHISKLNKVPFIITEHLTSYLMGYITNNVDLILSKEIFEYADGALIVSNGFRMGLERQLHLRENTFTVIHNLVNDLFFNSLMPIQYQEPETFRFFTNSFLTPRKNINLIIGSLKVLVDKGMNVHLTIGGDGVLFESLNEYVKSLNLQNHIHFTGKLLRHEVKEELDNCHSFLLASNYETFGVVIIESLACGRPVVITDSVGPKDFMNDDLGILVKKHTIKSFSNAMMQIIRDYNKYDQQKIMTFCKNNFNEHKIAKEIVDFYQKITAKRLI